MNKSPRLIELSLSISKLEEAFPGELRQARCSGSKTEVILHTPAPPRSTLGQDPFSSTRPAAHMTRAAPPCGIAALCGHLSDFKHARRQRRWHGRQRNMLGEQVNYEATPWSASPTWPQGRQHTWDFLLLVKPDRHLTWDRMSPNYTKTVTCNSDNSQSTSWHGPEMNDGTRVFTAFLSNPEVEGWVWCGVSMHVCLEGGRWRNLLGWAPHHISIPAVPTVPPHTSEFHPH